MKKKELKAKITEAWKEVYAQYDKNEELSFEIDRLKLELDMEKAKKKEIVYIPYTFPYQPYPFNAPVVTYEPKTVCTDEIHLGVLKYTGG